MFAASFVWAFTFESLLHSEYFPLIVGVGVALTFLVVGRRIAARPRSEEAPQLAAAPPIQHPEFDPFMQGSPTEQRASFRRTGNPVEVEYSLTDDKEHPRRGLVFDRSVKGLGLATGEAHSMGTILVVRPKSGETTAWVEVKVCTCRQDEDGQFRLGCQFVKTPPWSVLLLFG